MQLGNQFVASPLNYTGGKFSLLSQILPFFPKRIETFIDIFAGGCNVGANVVAKKIICNDINEKLIGLLNYLKSNDIKIVQSRIMDIINEYNLSDSEKNGYSFYGCNSSDGLGKYNKSGFNKLRSDFNKGINDTWLSLYVLIVYSFNNQIRFNSKGEFNLPVGKRDFNRNMRKKLECFMNRIKEIVFSNLSFLDYKPDSFDANTFIYADPPYLITCASYNENQGWNSEKESLLLKYLDLVDEKKCKFALSNVLSDNGKKNTILADWLKDNKKKYKCHHLNNNYKNSNYHKKNIVLKTDEVLITNY